GRMGDVQGLQKRMRSAAQSSEAARWAADTGADLVDGFAAFWQGRYDEAIEKLWRARAIANRFGGSHAQRDVIDWTLTEAALRGNRQTVAEAMARERLAQRPHSGMNRQFLRRALAPTVRCTP